MPTNARCAWKRHARALAALRSSPAAPSRCAACILMTPAYAASSAG